MLCDPNPNSPANSEAAKLYQGSLSLISENRALYDKRVKEIVENSWGNDDEDDDDDDDDDEEEEEKTQEIDI